MHIQINLFESKEVTISQIKKEKKRPGDQYDFNDPMFEKLPDEDQYVKIEPVLKDFRIINPLAQNITPDKKEKTVISYLDTIYAQQNQIYAKIKENTFTEEDMFTFLMYDLMINHDLQFKKLKSKFLHFDITKFCCEEFLTKIFQNFVYARSKLREQLSKLGSQEETYKDENIVFSDQICDTICKYIDILCLTRCFESEVIKKRQFKYIPFKKNIYFEVSLLFRVRSKNIRNLGNSISRYTKKNKLGKNNGYSLKYLE